MSHIGGYHQAEIARKKSHINVPSLLPLLPSLSAQQCPIVIIREDSTLTKRISYSENLKDRLSFHCDGRTTGFKEPASNNCASSSSLYRGDGLNLKGDNNPNTMETLLQNKRNSLRECQQIFVKLQRKLSNMSLKHSNTKKTDASPMFPGQHKLVRRTRSTAEMMKADRGRQRLVASHSKRCTKHIKNGRKMPCHKYISGNVEKGNPQSRLSTVDDGSINHGDVAECANSLDAKGTAELKNVFYSERQSANVDNVPGAPPCTPIETTSNRIASLSDIKSQRNVQQKLQELLNKNLKKEKKILEIAKVKAAANELEQRKKLMEKQRLQVYSINKIMAEVEYQNFLKFKSQVHGVPV